MLKSRHGDGGPPEDVATSQALILCGTGTLRHPGGEQREGGGLGTLKQTK